MQLFSRYKLLTVFQTFWNDSSRMTSYAFVQYSTIHSARMMPA